MDPIFLFRKLLCLIVLTGIGHLWAQCPMDLDVSITGTALTSGAPVCINATLDISIEHDPVSFMPEDLALYWSTISGLATESSVYGQNLIQENITVTIGTGTTMAAPWTLNDPALDGLATISIYAVRETSSAGLCGVVEFVVHLVQFDSNPSDQTVCTGTPTSFNSTAINPALGEVRWQVNDGGGFEDIQATDPDYSGEASLDLDVLLSPIALDGNLYRNTISIPTASTFYCQTRTSNALLTVLALPDPTLTITPASQDVCDGDAASITIQNAESGVTYVLKNAAGTQVACGEGTGSNLVLSFVPTTSGTYTIEAGIGDVCGSSPSFTCSVIMSTMPGITVNSLPTVSIDAAGPFCSEDPIQTLTATVSPMGGSGTWSGSGIVNAGTGEFDPAVATIGSNSVSYTYTDLQGCSNSDMASISVIQSPDLQDVSTFICENETVDFSSLAIDNSGLSSPPFEYFMTIADAQAGSPTIPSTETFNSSGTFFRFYRRNNSGCIDIATITITVNNEADINIVVSPASQNVCNGDMATISILASEIGITYVLFNSANTQIDCAAGTGATLNFSFTPSSTDTYHIEAGIGACGPNPTLGCPVTLSTMPTVNVRNVSVGAIGSDETICEGSPTQLFDGSSANGDGGSLTFIWMQSTSGAGGPFSQVGGNSSTFSMPSISQTSWFQLNIESDFGDATCTASSNIVEVTLNNVSPGSIAADQTICEGETPQTFTNISSGSGAGTILYKFEQSTTGVIWNDAPGATFNVNSSYVPVNPLSQTTLFRRLVRSDLNSVQCFDTSNVLTVTVNPLPSVLIDPAGPFCTEDGTTNLNVNLNPGGGSGSWTGPGITNNQVGTFDPMMANLGSNSLQYDYTDLNGCANSDTEIVFVNQSPDLQDVSTTVCVGDQVDYVNLSIDNSGLSSPPFQYFNTLSDAQTGTAPISSLESFAAVGTFTRFYRRLSNGCLDIAMITIIVDPPPSTVGVTLTPDASRICVGDQVALTLCGLSPNTQYEIHYTNPITIDIFNGTTDGSGCMILPTSPLTVSVPQTYQVRGIFFPSGCGISISPTPPDLSAAIFVNDRPDITGIQASLEDPFCFGTAPQYQLSNLAPLTDFTFSFSINGNSQSFDGTTDALGGIIIPTNSETQDVTINLEGVNLDDGDTECAADPPPALSKTTMVRPDLSGVSISGNLSTLDISGLPPNESVRLIFDDLPTEVVMADNSGNAVIDVDSTVNKIVCLMEVQFATGPGCGFNPNMACVEIGCLKPVPSFTADASCYTHEAVFTNTTLPDVSAYTYTWKWGDSTIAESQDARFTFPDRVASESITLIARLTDNCRDSVTQSVSIDISGPQKAVVQDFRREGAEGDGKLLIATDPGGADSSSIAFQWYKDGTAITGATLPWYFTENVAEVITVGSRYIDGQSDCETRSGLVFRQAGSAPVPEYNQISLYPNPNQGTFILKIEGEELTTGIAEIFDMQGRVVWRMEVEKDQLVWEQKIQLTVPPGLYLLQWHSDENPLNSIHLLIH